MTRQKTTQKETHMATKKTTKSIPVIITTPTRDVWYGHTTDPDDGHTTDPDDGSGDGSGGAG